MDKLKPSTSSTPPESVMHMPAQDFSKKPSVTFAFPSFKTLLARLITFGGGLGLTIYATYQMVLIVSQSQVTWLQWLMVGLFSLTFVWIALAACAAIAGFILPTRRKVREELIDTTKKTVLLMPVYNEDPNETCSALLSMGKALAQQGVGDQFEIFIISDSTNPRVWVKETAAVAMLREELGGEVNVWYRRRLNNKAKKAGNVHEFVTRWGGRYDYMIVLDADSLLRAETLISLMAEMQADPKSGILQTLPSLYRGDTLFARMQQFAGTVYGPIVAQGITAWQGDDGNYWGHNAIIRVEAFATAAGLPTIGGIKPFKGDILSHDFVEAALIRRAGWSVRMLPHLKGSWEESPPSLSDVAIRDRRWAQGNIQHLAVMPAKGLRWPNQFHMITGVMGYMASPLWFMLILTGIALAIQTHYGTVSYFSEGFSLFPTWPVFDSERMVQLFIGTMGILLVPKVLGYIRACFNSELRKSLGVIRMFLGMLLEIFLSVLYAPIFMLVHCKHVFDILRGKDSGWATQQRQSSGTPWLLILRQHFWHFVIGLTITGVLWKYAPALLYWLAPTLIGLWLVFPLAAMSSSKILAKGLRMLGLLNVVEEVNEPEIMRARDTFTNAIDLKTQAVNVEAVLTNNALNETHFSYVQGLPEPVRGHAPIHKLSAIYKVNDADSLSEAISWLDDKELMALLSDKEVLDVLKSRQFAQ
jgi:membrane glycosyltransferase